MVRLHVEHFLAVTEKSDLDKQTDRRTTMFPFFLVRSRNPRKNVNCVNVEVK